MTGFGRDPGLVGRYEGLIDSGVYRSSTEHGSPDKAIVREVLEPFFRARPDGALRVLDSGCGPGEWLEEVHALASHRSGKTHLSGFDITPGMIDLARERLVGRVDPADIKVGDVLMPETYSSDPDARFDLVYTFDVVQQLPTSRQWDSVQAMLSVVAPGGSLVIFDHDGRSLYGRKMRTKKVLRRYLHIPLVPAWYVYSVYPPLGKYASRLAKEKGLSVRVVSRDDTPRRALIVDRSASPEPRA